MGDTVPGLVIDNVEGTPYVTGMLAFEELKGISLLVPFLNNTPQFASVKGWARDGRPASPTLQEMTGSGAIHLVWMPHFRIVGSTLGARAFRR